MNKTEQAQQLRLAAELIETGHPFEFYDGEEWIAAWNLPLLAALNKSYLIRPVLATPPDNRPLHNPDNLTAEQVGLGYRLAMQDESALQPHEVWSGSSWFKALPGPDSLGSYNSTYRLPLPWPEAPKPETTKQVELGPEDVPPGTVLRGAGEAQNYDGGWCMITSCSRTGIRIWRECDSNPTEITWQTIKDAKSEINRSIPLAGKWDATAWEPCFKTVQIAY
jgi:hypothetical protein